MRLWVAIADVSHYVRPRRRARPDARERGTSVYFPRRVIPMLPEKLSNGLCSLNPNVDRLAMVCEMAITPQGKVARYEFYAAVFRSHARLTYTEVWEMLSGGQGDRSSCRPCYDAVPGAARRAHAAAARSTSNRRDAHGVRRAAARSRSIVPEPRNDAHRLIEECMLAANVCAGDFLAAREHPVLYRVHDVPAAEKVKALREFLAELGLDAAGRREAASRRTTRKLLEQHPQAARLRRCCRPSCCAR